METPARLCAFGRITRLNFTIVLPLSLGSAERRNLAMQQRSGILDIQSKNTSVFPAHACPSALANLAILPKRRSRSFLKRRHAALPVHATHSRVPMKTDTSALGTA